MKFSYNWLQSFLKQKLPSPKKLAQLLTMHFAEVEEVEKEGKDFILDIDIRPNRAGDCFSHLGIAREINVILGYRLQVTGYRLKEDKKLKAKDFVAVEVKDKNVCPRYTARVITNVKVGPSPKSIKDRLQVCGLRPINNIVDIANYVMLETGQPLHVFDFEKIETVNPKSQILNSKQIPNPKFQTKKLIVRFAKKNEKIITLDDEKYNLDEDILIIADLKEPLAIAGIKGGKRAEIDKKTKTIVLESANFNPRVIRKGSRKIALKTDASWRFEHGIDPNLTEFAINRAAALIQEVAYGKVAQGLVDFYPTRVLPKKIKLDLSYIKSLLGIEIPKKEIIKILTGLGFKCKESGSKYIDVTLPTFRIDVSLPEDLIEEIGRIYGYEKVPSVFPTVSLIPPKRNLDIFWEDMVKDILKEAGLNEVYNYSFISEKDVKNFGYVKDEVVEVANPISSDFQYLRPSLIPNLLKNVEKNQKNFRKIRIFELGKTFNSNFKEKKALTGLIVGPAFYEAKGTIDSLLNKLGISNVWYDEYRSTPEESKSSIWYPRKSAEIKIDNEEIGFLGEIALKVLEDSKVEESVVVFDFDFGKLVKLASEEQEYQPISRFPAAVRDLAILVPKDVLVEEVLSKISIAGGSLVRDVDLFDIYEGEELPEGKKNLAFHVIYQAEDRTLSSKEIDGIQSEIIKVLENEPDWEVRK